MVSIEHIAVENDDEGIRLDRWFKRHYPQLSHGMLQKALRKGSIRVDGKRVKANHRLEAGQTVRVPYDNKPKVVVKDHRPKVSDELVQTLQDAVIFKDDKIIVLNKPAGLAVQGGTKVKESVDAGLDALQFEAKERPKLVHRLDKDTSGILLLARTTKVANQLAEGFRHKRIHKTYWAVVRGMPESQTGLIDLPLQQKWINGNEQTAVDKAHGKAAKTTFIVCDHAGKEVSWLEMQPITGRKHQLRVHAEAIGNPIIGDKKYGGKETTIAGISEKLHLHAYAIEIDGILGKNYNFSASLPQHMQKTFEFFGFDIASRNET